MSKSFRYFVENIAQNNHSKTIVLTKCAMSQRLRLNLCHLVPGENLITVLQKRVIGCPLMTLALMAFLMVGCMTSSPTTVQSGTMTSKDAPTWVADKDSVYPDDKYLAEIGEGDSLNGAKANAAGAIAQIFRTQVTVDSSIRTRYTEITGEGDALLDMVAQTDVDQNIAQSADESLSNLKYGESWQNDMGRVYTIAYLDRAETGNLYRQRIVKNDNRVMELVDQSRTQEEGLRRYAYIEAALVMAEANYTLVEQLEIINMPLARTILHPYDLGDLRTEKADQAAAIRVEIEVSGDVNDQIEAFLIDWVTSNGFSVVSDGDMFLSAVLSIQPVQLNNGYENLGWELNLNLLDSRGIPAVTLPMQSRSSGISQTAAQSRLIQDIGGMINKDFNRAFIQYLDSFLEK